MALLAAVTGDGCCRERTVSVVGQVGRVGGVMNAQVGPLAGVAAWGSTSTSGLVIPGW